MMDKDELRWFVKIDALRKRHEEEVAEVLKEAPAYLNARLVKVYEG